MRKVPMILAAMLCATPLIAAFILSFINTGGVVGQDSIVLLFDISDERSLVSLDNYKNLLFNAFIFYPMFWNSVLYATVITLIQFIIIIPCAFGFTQARFRGKRILFIFYIILMMMPLQVTILPNYIGLREFGLLDTRIGIILPAIFSPFGVVVLCQYMKGIDNSVIDAMRLETSSVIRIMLFGVVPQIKVCLFAVGVFVFAESWNMLEQPLLFLKSELLQTLPVMLASASHYEGSILFPAAVLFMIPVLLLYGFFNGSLEKGLAIGDLK